MTSNDAETSPTTMATAAIGGDRSVPDKMIKITGQQVNGAFMTRYVLGLFGLWIAIMTPASVTLAIRIGSIDPDNKAASLSLVAGLGALCALFANPIFGRLSDRSTSRFGQRRPFIIGGTLCGAAGTLLIGFAPSIAVVVVGWCIAQVSFNAALAAMVAVLPERIPSRLRGRVSAWLGAAPQAAIVAGTFFVQWIGIEGAGMFLAPAALGIVLVCVFTFGLKEVPRSREEIGPLRILDIFGALWINPIKYSDFAFAWLGRFLLGLAMASLTTYKVYFLTDHLGMAQEDLPPILFLAMLVFGVGAVGASVLAGWMSDLAKRRKIFVVVASCGFAAAMVVVATAGTVEQFIAGVAVAGISQGAYLGVDYALVSEVLPNAKTEAAKGMGVFNLAQALPQTFAPMLAPMLLLIAAAPGSSNYTSLYLAAAIFGLAGAVAVLFIRKVR